MKGADTESERFSPVEVTNAMALQGNIDSFSVVDVLRLLGSSAKSGRLVVDGDRGSGSLWLADGLVVAGTTTRSGSPVVVAPPSDVLFDLLRFSEGSFVFDAGVEPTESVRSDAVAPIEIEPMIAGAEESLVEWDDIVALVPSLRTSISLVLDLADESVVIDRRAWSGIVAVAAGVAATGDRTTVGVVAELTGLSELPAMRLVRDLVVAGLVEAGGEVVDERRPMPTAFDDAAFEPAPFESGAFAPPGDAAFGAPAFEPAGLDDVAFDPPPVAAEAAPPAYAPPAYEPADVDLPSPQGTPVDVLPPIGNIGVPTPMQEVAPNGTPDASFDAFAPFDPFGTAEPSRPGTADPVESGSAVDDVASSDDDVVEADPVSEEERAAQQAEFARQLAMLSPRAAEAVASAEAGPSTEDEERARVARFLGSV